MSRLIEKKIIFMLLLVMAVLVFTAGCGGQETGEGGEGEEGKEVYKIGAIFDITGSASSLGVPERNTAKMLEDKINEEGGIDGHQVRILIEDNESNETKAVQVAKKLIDRDDVLAIAGPSTTGTSMAIIDTAQRNEVPMVSAAAGKTIVNPVEDRQWIFKTAQNDSVVVNKIIEHFKEEGIDEVAFMSVNDAYGDSGRQEFENLAPEAGIEIVAREKFGASDKDMTSQLTKIKAADPEAVVVWAIPPAASIVTKNYREIDIDAPLVHSHGVGNKTFLDLAGESADGVIFPIGKMLVAEKLPDDDPQKDILVEYVQDYEEKFDEPRSSFGGYAWDAIYMIVEAIEKAGSDRAGIRDELENMDEFIGISGIFNMSGDDHSGLTKESLIMVEVVDGEWEILE